MPAGSASAQGELIQALCDRYRCPVGMLDFRLAGHLSRDARFFRFGSGTMCYGRCAPEPDLAGADSPLSNTWSSASCDDNSAALLFDPDEVIRNLHLERYPTGQFGNYESLFKRVYYWLRPYTNQWVRKYVQRFRAAGWHKQQFPHWPVDTTVESICESLLALSMRSTGVESIPFVWFWPDAASGCFAMTHDVEEEAGRDFCERLMDLDEGFGVKASFQIVPEGRYKVTAPFLNRLRDRGFEVCVQDLNHDGRLFDERGEFLRRVARINNYGQEYGAKGYRSAVLYRKPEWYGDLKFSFDMSIPNVSPLDPQRGGCCTVMPYFIGDILEIPLTTTQDYTLFHLLNKRSIGLWKEQLEIILSKNGLASFLVHPDYIRESDTQAVYRELLSYLSQLRKEKNLWFALPREIDNWWRARSRMSVVQDQGSWRIVGEGSERAVLAFAKLVDGKLQYELSVAQPDPSQAPASPS